MVMDLKKMRDGLKEIIRSASNKGPAGQQQWYNNDL